MKYDSSLIMSSSLPVKTKTSHALHTLKDLLGWVLIGQMKHDSAFRIKVKPKRFCSSKKEIIRILVVDDSKEVQDLLNTVFYQCGCTVEIANNGLEALRKFNDGIFDIVLTDICMPGINGNVLSKRIKDSDRTIPIIAITASPTLAEHHFDEVLSKPFDLEFLLSIVKDALSRSNRYQSVPGLENLKKKLTYQRRR